MVMGDQLISESCRL